MKITLLNVRTGSLLTARAVIQSRYVRCPTDVHTNYILIVYFVYTQGAQTSREQHYRV